MAAHLPQLPRVILYEGKDSQPFAAEVRQELMVKLLDRGYTVSRATERGRLENLGHEKVIVVGIFDRAMPLNSLTQYIFRTSEGNPVNQSWERSNRLHYRENKILQLHRSDGSLGFQSLTTIDAPIACSVLVFVYSMFMV